jgi:diguanylate cyclase (GGDEF)-like protein/PAS domain S-box-containing protein
MKDYRASLETSQIIAEWPVEELLRAVVSSSPLPIYVVDPEGSVQLWNPACEHLFGWPEAEVLGQGLPFCSPNAQLETDQLRRTVLSGKSIIGLERTHQHRDGRLIELSFSIVPLRDEAGKARAILGIAQDVTARNVARAASVSQARFDALTGLHNRVHFLALLDEALGRSRCREAVVCLGLDSFKHVNDSHGHVTGDDLLRAVAERLEDSVRLGDVVARLDGDVFAVLLRGVGPRTVDGAVSRLFDGLSGAVSVAAQQFALRATAGVALCRPGGRSQDVLRSADVAMYEAKTIERGGFLVFDQSMQDAVNERISLEAQLVQAPERGELAVYYQPTFALADGALTGVEALVRWEHPDLGLLTPERFIHLGEANGSIVGLGRWVLHSACRQLCLWRERYPAASSLVMSVNLSPRQLRDPQLPFDVSQALEDCSLDPSCLQLEVTETVLAADGAQEALARLQAIGVGLAIDDFGTGYSSLTSLRRYPFDTLKVDRSFVAGIEISSEDRAIVVATLGLSVALGLRTVAEGVETRGQLEMLTESGCDEAQGYLLGRPEPAAAIDSVLAG